MAPRQSAAFRRKGRASGQSETELSVLVRKELGIEIEPKILVTFVNRNFTILSILCHEIHNAEPRDDR